jgi:hypothetical protein
MHSNQSPPIVPQLILTVAEGQAHLESSDAQEATMTTTAPALRAYSFPGLDKPAFIAELAEHAAQDRIVQGQYWENGKGCAVGCSLHSVQQRLGLARIAYDDHALYETYLGIPRILARLEDRIFEGLEPAEARLWPMRFAEAVQPGADLSGVWHQFAPWLLREIALPAVSDKHPQQRAAIVAVAEGFETNWSTLSPGEARRLAAAYAAAYAYAYAYAAAAYAYAADAAAADAAAAAAADAAYAAAAADAAAAAAAAYAAAAARRSARHKAYNSMAAKLCELISAAPINELSK